MIPDLDSAHESSPSENAIHTLREFIASSPAAFIMFDRNLCQIEASPRWKRDFGGIAVSLHAGQHFYESYPDLPKHLRAAHRKGLAGETTRAPHDHFKIKGQEVFCAWEVRPWGDIRCEDGGIIVYAENLSPLFVNPPLLDPVDKNPKPSNRHACVAWPTSSLMSRGIQWGREASDAIQKLLSGYREVSCKCGAQSSPPKAHEQNCPAHPTVPMIVEAEQAVRRLCSLEELLRKKWTLPN